MTGKRMGTAAVILDEQGWVLLVKHSYGKLNWELPGGGAEANESISDTAVREVREETGLEVEAERLTGTYYDRQQDFNHFVLRCRIVGTASAPAPQPPKITDCGYWPVDALPCPISDFTVRRIEDALGARAITLPVEIGPHVWIED